MVTCRAPVFVGASKPLEMRNYVLPDLEEDEALVKMNLVGICGTDVHRWHDPTTPTPMIFGHENLGTLTKLAKGKKFDAVGQEIAEGDHVVFGGKISCGSCYICAVAKEPTVCERGIDYGLSPNDERPYLRGGYGEYVHLIPRADIVRVPDGYGEKALLAVIGNATMLHGIEKMGGVQPGTTAVIQGSGPVGLAALIQCRAAGAESVIVVGAPKRRLELAKTLGASETVDIGVAAEPGERVKLVREITDGNGADIVIEASGGRTAVDEGIGMTRIGGRYLIIGQASDYGSRPVNPYWVTRKQLRVYGSWAYTPSHVYRALKILKGIDLPLRQLISHRFSIDEATPALKSVDTLESVIAVISHSK